MCKANGDRLKTIDMVGGSLWKNIFLFSVPLMCSQLLEVLFNISDVAVVGKFADYKALGAVGSTTLLVSLFIGFLIGMGSGVNVQVALGLGARDKTAVENTIHTSFLLCLLIGIFTGLSCFYLARPVLTALHTKPDLIDEAVLYLKIYALGLPGMAIYNFGNGVLSAAGETRKPLVYLTIAGILNIILNLIFVIVFHMAAAGVALASMISQYVSAVLIIFSLLFKKDECRLCFSRLRFHGKESKAVLSLGISTGLQNAIFAIANLFVQMGVNSFDTVMVSGNSAASNADTVIFSVLNAFYTACASFIGQNRGANKKDRILKSYSISLFYSVLVATLLGLSLLVFGRQFLSLFANEKEVIEAGMQRLRIMGFSFAVVPFMDCTIAASRGLGRSVAPTVIVVLGSCIFRVVWIYTVFAYFHTIPSLYLLYFFSWLITAIAEIIYFRIAYGRLNV